MTAHAYDTGPTRPWPDLGMRRVFASLFGVLAFLPAGASGDVIQMPDEAVGIHRLIWAEKSEDGLYKVVTQREIEDVRIYYAHALNCEGWTVARLGSGSDYASVKAVAMAADLKETEFQFLDPDTPDQVVEPLVEYVCSNVDNEFLVVEGSDRGAGSGYRMITAEPEGEDRVRYVAFGALEDRDPLYLSWLVDCRARVETGGAEGPSREEALSRAAQSAMIAPRRWVPIAEEAEDEYLWHLAALACRRVYGVQFPGFRGSAEQ